VFGQDITVKVTSYFAGGSYELDQGGVMQADGSILVSATTTMKYYSFAGQPVAMTTCANGTCSSLSYFLTDQLGSVVTVTDAGGALQSQQPFGRLPGKPTRTSRKAPPVRGEPPRWVFSL